MSMIEAPPPELPPLGKALDGINLTTPPSTPTTWAEAEGEEFTGNSGIGRVFNSFAIYLISLKYK
jgi:hypothetical protein